MVKRSTMVTVTAAVLALLAAAAPAMAGTDQFLNSYALGPGAYSSTSRHTGVLNSHKNGFGVTCPALAQNYIGFTGSPNGGDNNTAGTNCGTGDRIWRPNGTAGILFRGAVWNKTLGTQAVTFGRYSW